jgi:hypothetical protein
MSNQMSAFEVPIRQYSLVQPGRALDYFVDSSQGNLPAILPPTLITEGVMDIVEAGEKIAHTHDGKFGLSVVYQRFPNDEEEEVAFPTTLAARFKYEGWDMITLLNSVWCTPLVMASAKTSITDRLGDVIDLLIHNSGPYVAFIYTGGRRNITLCNLLDRCYVGSKTHFRKERYPGVYIPIDAPDVIQRVLLNDSLTLGLQAELYRQITSNIRKAASGESQPDGVVRQQALELFVSAVC